MLSHMTPAMNGMDNLESTSFTIPPQQHRFFASIYITPAYPLLLTTQNISSHFTNSPTHYYTSTTMASSSFFFTSPYFTTNLPNSPPISATFATSNTTARSARPSSLYEVLGIQIGADTMEIKSAYRRLARVVHPDVGNMDSSTDEFIKVHSAYATLSDPGKRADYDRSLFVRQEVAGRSSSSAGYSGRRWETDQCW
ncbi:putative DnaJ domain, Chaperone J-domain superfamily [Helianthus annuus]|nr:putative DnaJ domain, Chaperone J-domain superfamily [Helianthus annuus]